jgi:predicted peptidase
VIPRERKLGLQRWSWAGLVVILVLSLAAGGCGGAHVAASTQHFPEKTGFVQRSIIVDGVATNVWVFVPPDYSRYRLYPAILFLHGLFEGGNGGTENVLSAGLGPIIARAPDRWPFITIMPQSNGTWRGPERDRLAMAALDDAEKHYSIDRTHVILAGLSYGGLGVWEIGARHPDRFAALVPVSGQSDEEAVEKLASVPVWAFASESDPIVGSNNSADMCRQIQARGGRARLTVFKGTTHDCWADAVDQTELVRWMLVQTRNPLRATAAGSRGSGRLRSLDDP